MKISHDQTEVVLPVRQRDVLCMKTSYVLKDLIAARQRYQIEFLVFSSVHPHRVFNSEALACYDRSSRFGEVILLVHVMSTFSGKILATKKTVGLIKDKARRVDRCVTCNFCCVKRWYHQNENPI